MQKYQNNIAARNGDAVVGIKVLIKLAGTATPATIYSDDGVNVTPNPLTTNANGYFEFYVANGLYDIAVSGVNAYTDVLIADALGIDAEALKKTEAAAPSGATLLGTDNGDTVQEALDGRLKVLTDGTEYLPPDTEVWTPRVLSAGQGVLGDGATKTIRSIGGGLTAITMANMSAVGRMQFNGEGKTSGTPGTVGVYSEAWGGSIDQLTVQDVNGTAVRAKGGWNLNLNNLRVTRCTTGVEFIEYVEVLPGWAGSGHVIGPAFITYCDVGIDIGKLWNPTLINVVLEYCDVPAKFSGTHQVIINPWFEGNTNTPLWTRGAVLMGGRGVTFQSTLDADLPGVSAGSAQEEAITWLDEQGISVFRDPAQRLFYATGRKGVQALRHFGVEGLTELAVQGRHFMPTAVTADFSSLRGYGAREGTFVTPADQYSANHETSAVVNRGTRSGDVISGAVVIRTGTKGAVPGDSTSADRWQFNASGHLVPFANITYDIGTTALRSRAVYSDSFRVGTTQGVFGGTASPEASITANPGSIYMRNDSTGGNTVWLKSSGTGNTGWLRMQGIRTGTTAQRPADADTGTMYLDTTLSKPIWKLGANWIDATGTTV